MIGQAKRYIPWQYRFRRNVPAHHRKLIARFRLPKPNWFVGAAEHAPVPRDPELVAEIEDVKRRLRSFRALESRASDETTPVADANAAREAAEAPAQASSKR